MANDSLSLDPDPESAKWLGIIYTVFIAVGIPINLLLLTLTITTENLRNVPLNICIISLAFADMMSLVFFLNTPIWALTNNMLVCKIMGVGNYTFLALSLALPSCLAICRYAAICDKHELNAVLLRLRRRNGIIALNALYWYCGLTSMIPFVLADKFGLDGMGFCGLIEFDSIFLRIYFVAGVGVFFILYSVTFYFYRKLGSWVQTTSSIMTMTPHTEETLMATRGLMRMMKWLLFQPVVFLYPALLIELLLRIFPGFITVHTARLFLITGPLQHIFDPIITMFFVKRYRVTVSHHLFSARASIHVKPFQIVHLIPNSRVIAND